MGRGNTHEGTGPLWASGLWIQVPRAEGVNQRGLSYVTSGTGCVLVSSSGKDSVSRSVASPLFFYPPRKLVRLQNSDVHR